ncbi:ribosomal protein L7/L12 [Paenibacillus sp. 2TAB19]|uniref:ribosomal protein L7/L12 n=1 Tax=Paenibacillus sp. 2TAB19 TaxID=3233003 RepID=UPI003F9516E9
MESVEWIALSALILSLVLLLKVFNLQRQLNEIKSDLQGNERLPYSSPGSASGSVPANLDDRLRILVASGKRIQAIKELREVTDLGLREAKEYVDKMIGQ